jgi:hypothetical protein
VYAPRFFCVYRLPSRITKRQRHELQALRPSEERSLQEWGYARALERCRTANARSPAASLPDDALLEANVQLRSVGAKCRSVLKIAHFIRRSGPRSAGRSALHEATQAMPLLWDERKVYDMRSLLEPAMPGTPGRGAPGVSNYREAVKDFRRAFLLTQLRQSGFNQCETARKIGIHRNTLSRELDILGIWPRDRRKGRDAVVCAIKSLSRNS